MESAEDVTALYQVAKGRAASRAREGGKLYQIWDRLVLREKATSDGLWEGKVKSEGGGGLKLRAKFYTEELSVS